MNLQKDDRTIKQDQKLHTEDEEYPWILGNPKRISRMRSLDVSTVIYIDIWQNIAGNQRKKRILGSAINANK